MNTVDTIRKELRSYASKEKSKILQRFFKTAPGEYAHGDIFIGVMVPFTRKVAKKYKDISFVDIEKLLHSAIHEERLLALFILVGQFEKASDKGQEKIFELYLRNTKYINNWDLVDLSAWQIVGGHLFARKRDLLYSLVKSSLLWERRIAVLATFYFIKSKDFKDTFKIARILLDDKHDLIHKSVGWMLREIGKRDRKALEVFLEDTRRRMPRTMLRYAIEHFPESQRKALMAK